MDASSLQALASNWLCHSRRKDRQDVRVTKTMCGADCWTDHRLIVSKLNLRIQPARWPQVPKRLDVSKLKQDSKRQAFINDICSRLDAMELRSDDPEENWTVFRDTVHSSAMDSIGPVSRKHKDWFDENDEEIQGRGSVWDRSRIRLDTKLKVYKAVVLPTLLYACGTWTVYQRHAKRLNHSHTSCPRKLLKIKWQDRIPDTDVLKRAGMGKRSHGGQKKRYKDTLKASLKDFNMPTESWEQIAQDWAKWRGLIRRGASEYEAKRISEAEQKRAQRKARAKASPTRLSCSDLCCSICNGQFRARIGLVIHLRSHK